MLLLILQTYIRYTSECVNNPLHVAVASIHVYIDVSSINLPLDVQFLGDVSQICPCGLEDILTVIYKSEHIFCSSLQ